MATTLALFLWTMIEEANFEELRRVVQRSVAVTGLAGLLWGASMYLFRDPLGAVLMPQLRGDVADAVTVFAAVAPLAFNGFACMTTVAPSSTERIFIVAWHAVGASVNIVLLLLLADSEGPLGAAYACALSVVITNLGLAIRCAIFLRRMQ